MVIMKNMNGNNTNNSNADTTYFLETQGVVGIPSRLSTSWKGTLMFQIPDLPRDAKSAPLFKDLGAEGVRFRVYWWVRDLELGAWGLGFRSLLGFGVRLKLDRG